MDFAAAGLLDGLEGKERQSREQLLERLEAEGFSLEELKAAVAENRLALLPVERVLGARYTAAEIEERTGLSVDLLMRMRRMLGLPGAEPHERVFGEEEIAAAQSTKMFIDAGIGEEAIAEITRVLGEAMSRVASTTMAAFADTFLQAGDSEQDVAWRFAALAEKLVPAFSPVLLAAYKTHLREAVQRGMISQAELESGQLVGEQDLAVCFADMVGFTALGGQLEAQELGSVVTRFGELAAEVADSEVRLVKTIGDAAMLTCPEPAPLVSAALELVATAEEAELPALRAGLASGVAINRAGDFYGPAVNMASRVTGVARPGSVLCTQEVRDAAPDQFEWSSAGRFRLKGLPSGVRLYRPRRSDEIGDRMSSSRKRTVSRHRAAGG